MGGERSACRPAYARRNCPTQQRGIISCLDRPDQLIPAVQNLRRRHGWNGIRADHYDAVGDALMLTLEQCLGERFTPDVAVAWDKTYTALAEMIRMAAASEPPALRLAA